MKDDEIGPGGLPHGWAVATIGDTGNYINGLAFRPEDWGTEGRPIIRIQNLNTPEKAFNYTTRQVDDAYLIQNGDILVSWSASLDAYIWRGVEAVLNQHIFKVVPEERLVGTSFIFYLLKDQIQYLLKSEHLHGSTMKHINRGPFLATQISIPPLAEQKRIVAEIERQFSLLDASVANMKRVQANLKRFRSRILQDACTGKLVPTEDELACTEGRGYEPAAKLLERILAERRARWEAEQLAKMKTTGKEPKDDKWKARYEEPSTPDASKLNELPHGWVWSALPTLGQLNRGKSKHRPRNDVRLFGGPYPFIQTGDVRHSRGYIKKHTQTYSEFGLKQSRLWDTGTLCITIAANIAETGFLTYPACFPDSVVGFNSYADEIGARWVELFLRVAKTNLERYAPATAQKNINMEILFDVMVPLPPQKEQVRIVAEVDRQLSMIEALEKTVTDNLKRAERLRQRILHDAFAGKLVPQDPSDEPASELLARIKTERMTVPNLAPQTQKVATDAEKPAQVIRKLGKPATASADQGQLSLT